LEGTYISSRYDSTISHYCFRSLRKAFKKVVISNVTNGLFLSVLLFEKLCFNFSRPILFDILFTSSIKGDVGSKATCRH
jgi:hypothetical protein